MKYAPYIILLCLTTFCCYPLLHNTPVADPFSNPYKVTILDDHSVQLASKSDTLVLLLENSATFNDEYVVFIKK